MDPPPGRIARELAVEARGLAKRFGGHRAIDGVDLAIPRGCVYGVLGPNGAGKTTTLRILATLLRPDAGRATVLGHDVIQEPAEVRARVSLAGQFASVDEDLTTAENLVLLARLLGHTRRSARERSAELLEAFDLVAVAGRQVARLSGGMRRRLDIAASLIVTPDLLFLDEPTTGLDPHSRSNVWDVVRAIVAAGTTVVLTTQYLDEADRLADRIAVIDRGRVTAEGTRDELKASVGAGTVSVRLADPAERDRAAGVLAAGLCVPVRADRDPARLAAQDPGRRRLMRAGPPRRGGARRVGARRHRRQRVRARPPEPRRGVPRADGRRNRRGIDVREARHVRQAPETLVHVRVADVPAHATLAARPRTPRAGAFAASMAFAWRSLLKIKHVPEQLGDVLGIPIVFTLLFTDLFGGAIAGSTERYLQFLLPGSLALAVVFVTVYSGVILNRDLATGVFDRFRSMPVWSLAPIVGGLIGDLGRYLLASCLVIGLGLITGFDPHGGPAGVLAGVALVIAFASALSWVWLALGLVLRAPNAVMSVGFVLLVPLAFVSNIFVDPHTMPGALRAFADANPISHLATAERGLMQGTASGADLLWALGAAAFLVLLFAPLTTWLYRRMS